MKNISWRSVLTFSFKAIVAVAVLTTLFGLAHVNNALHPPRIIPPGNTLRESKIEFQPRTLWLDENAAHLAIYLDNPRRYQRRLIGFFD